MSTPPAEPFDATTLLSAALALGLRLRNWSFGASDHCFAVYCHLDSYVGTVDAKEDRLIATGWTAADKKTLAALVSEYNERMRLKRTAPASTER